MTIKDAVANIEGQSVLDTNVGEGAPEWVEQLRTYLDEEHGHYDRAVEYMLGRSLRRTLDFIEDGENVRMPPLKPEDRDRELIGQWYKHSDADRSEYLNKGKDAYFDRLDLDSKADRFDAKRVGMRKEYREIHLLTYKFLDEQGLIEQAKQRVRQTNDEVVEE